MFHNSDFSDAFIELRGPGRNLIKRSPNNFEDVPENHRATVRHDGKTWEYHVEPGCREAFEEWVDDVFEPGYSID